MNDKTENEKDRNYFPVLRRIISRYTFMPPSNFVYSLSSFAFRLPRMGHTCS